MRTGVITALEDEASTFPDSAAHFIDGSDLVVEVSGPGGANATRVAKRLLGEGCTTLVSWGVAGALHPDIEPGTLFVARDVVTWHGRRLTADEGLNALIERALKALDAQSGDVFAASHAVGSPREKSALHKRHGAHVVDMESAAIAAAAEDVRAKFASVRAVVDPAEFRLPHAALHGFGSDGRIRAARALAQILIHPAEIADVFSLARWYRAALARLSLAARALSH